MKTYLDCIPCFFRQALQAARIAGSDELTQKKILDRLSQIIPDFPLDKSPPEMSRIVYQLVRELTGKEDPFKSVKDKYNRIALDFYSELKEKIKNSSDSFLTSIRLAIAGNAIDYGVLQAFDINKEIKEALNKDFAIFDYGEFKEALDKTDWILYLADNCGEVVFDRILIEQLNKKVIYAVREKPVINDATIEDAKYCKIDEVATIISSGSDAAGTILEICSQEFLEFYKNAKLIISKGSGNYETLTNSEKPIFFLLKVKCPIIAKDTGCEIGDFILKKSGK